MKKSVKLIALNLALLLLLTVLPVQALAVSLTLGRTVEYSATWYENPEYTFTPSSSGLYTFTVAAKTVASCGSLYLYKDGEYISGIESRNSNWTQFSTTAALTAGKEYTVKHSPASPNSIAVRLSVASEPCTALQMSSSASFYASGKQLIFSFTPSATQWYTFTSTKPGWMSLRYSDFSYAKYYSEDYTASAFLTKNEPYYITLSVYGSGSGTLSVAAVDTVTINESYPYFNDKINLTSITIGRNVSYISEYAFVGCSYLKSITVDSSNPNYSSVDGVLFSKDKTQLIWYPAAKEGTSYTVPSTVTGIQYSAFNGSKSLMNVTVPSSVVSIGDYAFSDSDNQTIRFEGNAPSVTAANTIQYDEHLDSFDLTDTLYYTSGKTGWTNSGAYNAQAGTWNGYPLRQFGEAVGTAKVTALSPANGMTGFGYVSPTGAYVGFDQLSITFDKSLKIIDEQNYRAIMNFNAGTISIYRASDNQLIWSAKENSFEPGTSGDITVSYDKTRLIIKPTNSHAMLDFDTEYYIIVDAGVIQFEGGLTNPAISKGQ